VSSIDLSSISYAILGSVNQVLQAVASAVTVVFDATDNIFSDPEFVHGLVVAIMLGLVTGWAFAKPFGFDLLQVVRRFVSSLFTGVRDMAERLAI